MTSRPKLKLVDTGTDRHLAMADEELADGYYAGDDHAFTVLKSRHTDRQRATAMKICFSQNPDRAYEAVEQAWTKFGLTKIRGMRYDSARPFRPYIDRILRNECMNLRRDHQSEPDQWIDDASDPEDQNINPERRARLAEAALHLEECAAHLTPDEYRVYEAIFLDQAKYEEFVQLSGVPMGTVSTSVRRVRKKLASCLEQKGFRVADLC